MSQGIVNSIGGGTGSMSKPPEYTYSGVSEFHDEGDGINWWMALKTSGVITLHKLNNAKAGVEVFLVGGGAGGTSTYGGGGGGYVFSGEFMPEQGIGYQAIIGAGGEADSDGGRTSIFDFSVNGGSGKANEGKKYYGGAGGSGGGAGGWAGSSGATGGTNGGKGGNTSYSGVVYVGGAGGGVSTIPWEDEERYGRYAGGGGGGNGGLGAASGSIAGGAGGAGGGGRGSDALTSGNHGSEGEVNTGGGGGGKGTYGPHKGGSGIILIRNKRA